MDVVRLLALALVCMSLSASPTQQDLQNKLDVIQKQLQDNSNIWLKKLNQHKFPTHQNNKCQITILNHTSQTPKQQGKVLKSEESGLFGNLVQKPPTPDLQSTICFMPYISKVCSFSDSKAKLTAMQANQKSLEEALNLLKEELEILEKLQSLDHKYSEEIHRERIKQATLRDAQNLLKKNIETYEEEIGQTAQSFLSRFNERAWKFALWMFIIAAWIFMGMLAPLIVALLIQSFAEWVAKKCGWNYSYKIRKGLGIALNILFITISIMFFLFFYDSVSILFKGVSASAGLFIIKTLIKFLLWLAMQFIIGINIGDHLQVFNKDGSTSMGYVVDICTLHFVLYEDITLDTYLKNDGKAGRFFNVPIYRIFTSSIAIYDCRHGKITWDSLDFLLTFDSNCRKAMNIAESIAKSYSTPYRETAEQQYQESRAYAMQYMNPDPKVFIKSEKEGVRLCISYITDITNPDKTLELRSKIFIAVMEAFSKASDILVVNASEKES
ncbi:Mechanosensitive ion channel membrane protein [Helicobacter sp. NHP21005]|uniref:mechanosensitive ion channel domain-containing protein n=1 Tax=Helicobacter felistomachi TaxID=3040201 RepID=UPI0025746F16|nr:mechanosensitive ion channel domain-containing protein [Helicobacter sp. NHP21005]BEG56611.1 Mechanosensitive ion channel membrane protein [Helicobacter sp. NHP21005]